MQTSFHCLAVALLLAGTGTASAQAIMTRDAIDPIVIEGQPLQLTPAQRTTIHRTIVPQGRGRAPIVRERIVMEPVAPAPLIRERVVIPSVDTYEQDYAYAVGSRVPATARLAPIPPAAVAEVPTVRSYRYMRYHDRVLLIDPVTSTVVADVTGY